MKEEKYEVPEPDARDDYQSLDTYNFNCQDFRWGIPIKRCFI